ncbi:hypothetical protein PanWU01x14_104110 [Parasponia andersonii]|uniref:Uncharacterized protein n=1 Tax=Parasponia andersonii TaxID=3476 RepID=A0A2P5D1S0_PARAD|nr:hypothetical protein PanWU01x14_104110 [Parasponia andersonii]
MLGYEDQRLPTSLFFPSSTLQPPLTCDARIPLGYDMPAPQPSSTHGVHVNPSTITPTHGSPDRLRHETVMDKLDILIDLLNPRRNAQSSDEQQPSRDREIRDDGLDESVINKRLEIEDHPSYANSYTYETPPIVFHKGFIGVEFGDEIE